MENNVFLNKGGGQEERRGLKIETNFYLYEHGATFLLAFQEVVKVLTKRAEKKEVIN